MYDSVRSVVTEHRGPGLVDSPPGKTGTTMTSFSVVDQAGESVKNMMDVDGVRVHTFANTPEVQESIIRNMKDFQILDDDVLLSSTVKSGTHWGYEIVSMLMAGRVQRPAFGMALAVIDAWPEAVIKERLSSPRLLISHLPFDRLPNGIREKKTKVVCFLRNPKDIAVSYYYLMKGMKTRDYHGKFSDYLPLFIEEKLDYGWFTYILALEEAMKTHPIHLVYFEDMKRNGPDEIKRIAEFLGVGADDDLIAAIEKECQFKTMAALQYYPKETNETFFRKDFSMFRKGEIGDWKNHWTVAQSEAFDKLYEDKMKHSKLKFTYS